MPATLSAVVEIPADFMPGARHIIRPYDGYPGAKPTYSLPLPLAAVPADWRMLAKDDRDYVGCASTVAPIMAYGEELATPDLNGYPPADWLKLSWECERANVSYNAMFAGRPLKAHVRLLPGRFRPILSLCAVNVLGDPKDTGPIKAEITRLIEKRMNAPVGSWR